MGGKGASPICHCHLCNALLKGKLEVHCKSAKFNGVCRNLLKSDFGGLKHIKPFVSLAPDQSDWEVYRPRHLDIDGVAAEGT